MSTRDYDEALGRLSHELGLQKSVVSEAFVRACQEDLDELNGRSLSGWTFVAVVVDGAAFAEHAVVVALGITTDGEKKVPSVREGATEIAELTPATSCPSSWSAG